jgi:S1-C subfamily serine protease
VAPDGRYTTAVSAIDLLVVGAVGLSAFRGAQRGLVATVFGLVGFAVGALIGSRLAPLLLQGGHHSPWLGVAGLAGALIGGTVVQLGAGAAAHALRRHVHGPLAAADTAGGVAAGALLGLALAWLVAVVALEQPGLHLRRDVQRSAILPALLRAVPASSVLDALSRFDPLPVVPSIADRTLDRPDPTVPRDPGPRAALASVVRVQGSACGLGIQGSGWVIRPGIVVTNAHVIAGEHDIGVQPPTAGTYAAVPIAVDSGNDVAILRVAGLPSPRLRMASKDPSGGAVAMIGYPQNGPLRSMPGRAGQPVTALAPGAYGGSVRPRTVVPLRGRLEHGDSGGPVVDRRGRVVAMMFAADKSGGGGFGVPLDAIRNALASARGRVSSGPCIG